MNQNTPPPGTTANLSNISAASAIWNAGDETGLIMAIGSAAPGDTILIEANIDLTAVLSINKSLVFAAESAPVTLTTISAGYRHMNVSGATVELTFDGVTLEGDWDHESTGSVNYRGGINSTATNLILGGARIQNCYASHGGGIYVGASSTITIADGEISGNKADNYGGGLYGYTDSTINISGDAIIDSNTVTNQGGGVYGYTGSTITISGGKINGNESDNEGGGIYNRGNSTISGGEISRNIAVTNGGGILSYTNSTIIISGGEISNNKAAAGGGVYVYPNSTTEISSGKINGNESSGDGGGVHIYSSDVSPSTITISGGEISGNKSASNIGGGGVFGGNGSTITISGGKISGNTATGNGGGMCGFINSTINIYGNAVIDSNTVTNSGGGVYGYGGSTITISGGEINGNEAGSEGGGVYGTTTINIFDDAVICSNGATNGGGVYGASGSAITISGGEISDNTAYYGGGVYGTATSVINISGGEISRNKTTGSGGGIYIPYANLANLNIAAGVIFADNEASRAYDINPIDIPTHEAHILTDIFTRPFVWGYNNYDISYTNGTPIFVPVNVIFSAEKTAAGGELAGGKFEFGLFDADNVRLAITSNDARGNITFPSIPFEPGTYNFTIRELTPSGSGWTTDGTVFPVTLTVTNNGLRYIANITYPNGEPVFVDTAGTAQIFSSLQLERTSDGIIYAGEGVIFDHVLSSSGSGIGYDPVTGEITLSEAGFYNIQWFVVTEFGLTTDGSNFAIVTSDENDPEYTGSNHVRVSQTVGFAVIEVSRFIKSIRLINTSDNSLTLSQAVNVKANIAVFAITNS